VAEFKKNNVTDGKVIKDLMNSTLLMQFGQLKSNMIEKE
jgi:hypothetical protein